METTNRLQGFALAAAPHAAAVANYCEHLEHNEDVAMKFTIDLDIRALLPCAGGSAACGDRETSA